MDVTNRIERALNDAIGRVFREQNIYRIDHYLGKETVQNLMALRFANALFEPVWNAAHIDHVQITVAETLGVEGRAGYYNTAGALRDMVQNHMLQLGEMHGPSRRSQRLEHATPFLGRNQRGKRRLLTHRIGLLRSLGHRAKQPRQRAIDRQQVGWRHRGHTAEDF